MDPHSFVHKVGEWWRALWQRAPLSAQPMPPERAELFEQLHALQARYAHAAAVRETKIAALAEECAKAEARVDELRQKLAQAQYDKFHSSIQAGVEEDRLRTAIAGTIPTSLQMFLDEIDSELEALRHKEPFSTPEVKRDYTLMKKHLVLHSDGPSIARRVRALNQARQRAQAMIFEPITIETMNAEILRLQKTLPAIISEEIYGEPLAAN
jgi:hypothetical protein